MGGLVFYPLIYLVIAYGLVPVFLRLRVTSIYEYLEQRFDVGTRMFASAIFLVVRLNWMGLVLFSSTLALAQITQLDRLLILLGIGVIAVVYTTLGGMRAVIWTDVAQFFILFGGALFTVAYVVAETGTGPAAWWQAISAADRPSQPIFSFDPYERVTLVGMGPAGLLLVRLHLRRRPSGRPAADVHGFGKRGPAVQRLRPDFPACWSRWPWRRWAWLSIPTTRAKPPTDADQAFPYFIRSQLPRGLAVLVVAALFSAAMSSLDSGNELGGHRHQRGLRGTLALGAAGARGSAPAGPGALTVAVGLLSMLMCLALFLIPEDIRGNLLELAQRVSSFPVGGLGGLFLAAIWVRRCTGPIAVQAACTGMLFGLVVGWGHTFGVFPEDRPLSFMWIIPSSCLVTLLYAVLASTIRPRKAG